MPLLHYQSAPQEAQTWKVVVDGWLGQEAAEQFAAALGKWIPIPGITVQVVRSDGGRT